jgi:DNA-directed RNA polymerase sigma subunit (sigma70/sigma32)
MLRAVKRALRLLEAREAAVLRLHFGLGGRPQDLAGVARATGLSLTAVRRLQRIAFGKLRAFAVLDPRAPRQ